MPYSDDLRKKGKKYASADAANASARVFMRVESALPSQARRSQKLVNIIASQGLNLRNTHQSNLMMKH
jgi:hypothetical protein